MPRTVVVYTQPGRLFCDRVKEFPSERNVEFTERAVTKGGAALADLEKLGCLTTPVAAVDTEVVVGFNPRRLEELLP